MQEEERLDGGPGEVLLGEVVFRPLLLSTSSSLNMMDDQKLFHCTATELGLSHALVSLGFILSYQAFLFVWLKIQPDKSEFGEHARTLLHPQTTSLACIKLAQRLVCLQHTNNLPAPLSLSIQSYLSNRPGCNVSTFSNNPTTFTSKQSSRLVIGITNP